MKHQAENKIGNDSSKFVRQLNPQNKCCNKMITKPTFGNPGLVDSTKCAFQLQSLYRYMSKDEKDANMRAAIEKHHDPNHPTWVGKNPGCIKLRKGMDYLIRFDGIKDFEKSQIHDWNEVKDSETAHPNKIIAKHGTEEGNFGIGYNIIGNFTTGKLAWAKRPGGKQSSAGMTGVKGKAEIQRWVH